MKSPAPFGTAIVARHLPKSPNSQNTELPLVDFDVEFAFSLTRQAQHTLLAQE
jgi:hypothetical protein